MEEILKKITADDTTFIREGTMELREALKKSEALPALCSIMQGSPDSLLRQTAALVLKKRFSRSKYWVLLDVNTQEGLKDSLLKSLIGEPEKYVKNTIANAIGTIIMLEDQRKRGWPELYQFLQQTITSENQNDRELGFYTLSILTSIAAEQFMQYAGSFSILFNKALSSSKDQSSTMAYYVILCLTNFVPVIGDKVELKNIYSEILPKVISSIKALSTKRPDRAHDAMDLLYDLADGKTAELLNPRMKQIVNLCLDFIRDPSMKMDVQIKAFGLLAILVQSSIELIIKYDLIVNILDVVLKVMCEKPDDDENEDYFSADPDDDTLLTCACETLDEIALGADAEIIVPHIMEFVERGLKGSDPYIQKACYLSMGIVAQGADDYIKDNCVMHFTKLIIKGIIIDKPVIRNAALFALGQFTDFLQPEVNQFAGELIPILLVLLGQLEENGKSGKVKNTADRVFFVIEKFLENIEESIEGVLPELMQKLLRLSCPPYEVHLRQLAVGAIGSTANCVKEAIGAYFKPIMSVLNLYILQPISNEMASLQVESIDTLGFLIRNAGKEHFEPIADDITKVSLNLLKTTVDPDIRKACYGLFAAMSTVLKERIAPILPPVMESIITSMKSTEGVSNPDDDDNSGFQVYGSEDEDGEDDGNDEAFAVENDFIEEKEESCIALKELAENSGESFFPYLELSFVEVMKLLDFPSNDVKKAAAEASFQLVISFANIETPEGQNAASQAVNSLISKSALMVRTDEEAEVVIAIFECFQHLLTEIGSKLDISFKEIILGCAKDVLESKTECQVANEGEDEDEAEELCDTALEVIPVLGKMVSPEQFSTYFSHFTPLFKRRCEDPASNVKANTMGALVECLAPLGQFASISLNPFLTYGLCMSSDTDSQVRNNAIFFLGEYGLHAQQPAVPQYNMILNALFGVMPNEKNWKVLDNICGAIARLILGNPSAVPLERVVPALMENLPLKEDFVEDKWVFRSISLLYQNGEQIIQKCICHIIKCAAVSLQSHSPDDETKEVLVNLIKVSFRDFPEEFRKAASEVPLELVNVLQQCTALS